MISVSVETDIRKAVEFLNLLPEEADRAAYRAMNKIADEIKQVSAQEISRETGMTRADVLKRMYVRGASRRRLIATVHALPSAHNVGTYKGASPNPGDWFGSSGLQIKAWGRTNFYDKAFVKGKQKRIGVSRKVWRRLGPGKDNITDKVWGPSVRKSFLRPALQAKQKDILVKRWVPHFERYLRAEIVRLKGADSLKGVGTLLPNLTGPMFSE